MTLREEIQAPCKAKLDGMVGVVLGTAGATTDNTGIDPIDLLRLASGGRTDTLEKKLLRLLYDRAEEACVKIWNDQLDLLEKNPAEKL